MQRSAACFFSVSGKCGKACPFATLPQARRPCSARTLLVSLSAKQLQALERFKAVLKPGRGVVVVRDYAEGDLAEARLAALGRQKQLAPHFFLRGDGTRCLYFSEVLPSLCALSCGALSVCVLLIGRGLRCSKACALCSRRRASCARTCTCMNAS